MTNKTYTDPTTGEFVGEFETTDTEGNVSRQTEWFATEDEAKRFARTGVKPVKVEPEGERQARIDAAYLNLFQTLFPERDQIVKRKRRSHLTAL